MSLEKLKTLASKTQEKFELLKNRSLKSAVLNIAKVVSSSYLLSQLYVKPVTAEVLPNSEGSYELNKVEQVDQKVGQVANNFPTGDGSQKPMDYIDYENAEKKNQSSDMSVGGSLDDLDSISREADDLKPTGSEVKISETESVNQNRQRLYKRLRNLLKANKKDAYQRRVEGMRSGVANPGSSINRNNGLSNQGLEAQTYSINRTEAKSILISILEPNKKNTEFPDGLSHLYTESASASASKVITERTTKYTVEYPTEDLYLAIGTQVNLSSTNNESGADESNLRTLFQGTISPVVVNRSDGNFYLNPDSAISRGEAVAEDLSRATSPGAEVSPEEFENTVSDNDLVRNSNLFGELLPNGSVQRGAGFVLGDKLQSTNLTPNHSRQSEFETDLELSATYKRDRRGLNPQTGSFEITTDTRSLNLSGNISKLGNLASVIPWVVNKPKKQIVPQPFEGSFEDTGFTDQQLKNRAYVAHNQQAQLAPEIIYRGHQYTNTSKNGNVSSLVVGVGANKRTYLNIQGSEDYFPLADRPLRIVDSLSEVFDDNTGQVVTDGELVTDSFNGLIAVEILSGDGVSTLERTEKYVTKSRDEIFFGGGYSQSRSSKMIPSSNGIDPIFDVRGKLVMSESQSGQWAPGAQTQVNVYPSRSLRLKASLDYLASPDVLSPNNYTIELNSQLGKNTSLKLAKQNYFANQSIEGISFDNSLSAEVQTRIDNNKLLSASYDLQNSSGAISLLYADAENKYRVGGSFSISPDFGNSLGLGIFIRLTENSFLTGQFSYSWGNQNIFLPDTSYSGILKYEAQF